MLTNTCRILVPVFSDSNGNTSCYAYICAFDSGVCLCREDCSSQPPSFYRQCALRLISSFTGPSSQGPREDTVQETAADTNLRKSAA